jgi:hypothetical protein
MIQAALIPGLDWAVRARDGATGRGTVWNLLELPKVSCSLDDVLLLTCLLSVQSQLTRRDVRSDATIRRGFHAFLGGMHSGDNYNRHVLFMVS